MSKREGNRPDRRIAAATLMDGEARRALTDRVAYVGSATHKLHPGDYNFLPPQNPRPTKSPCDALRPVLLAEARDLFRQGIMRGMVSAFAPGQAPKYIWSVDAVGEVYESKARPERELLYHGYRIGPDEPDMRRYVLKEWKQRCR